MYKNDVNISAIPLNSSTETLQLPTDIDGKDILFAGLYWQGNIVGEDAANYNTQFSNINKHGGILGRDKVIMIDAKGKKHTITADKNSTWFYDFWGNGIGYAGGHRSLYQGYKDVTAILQNSYTKGVTNSYTVGNIKASAGKDYPTYFWGDQNTSFNGISIGFWANWQLIVVYSHSNLASLTPKPKPKNITIFHGFEPLIPLKNEVKSITINLSGFVTPKQAPVNAKMLFYGSGGEAKLDYDSLEIQNKKTAGFVPLYNSPANPLSGAFNGSISRFGTRVNPNITYYPGTDSDEFNISNMMDTEQSTTVLKLSTKKVNGTGDQFLPGLVAFSTDVYEPSFCYDYAYRESDKFFTEDNNGSQNPRIIGSVTPQKPITINIYLKSLIDSNVLVKDMKLTVQDINTTQAKYIRDSTLLTLNSGIKNPIFDSSIGSVSDSSINDIPIGTLNAKDHFSASYDLLPTVGTQDLNMTLNAKVSYTLETTSMSIPYSLNLSSDIPMCTSTPNKYTSEKGNFNMVHEHYYNYDTVTPTKRYYNLPTQITNRVGHFKIISIDENETLTPRSTMVAVEMIDASAFHSSLLSCQEISSSISPRSWMLFDAVESVKFDKTTLSNPLKFYTNAKENTAFRVSQMLDNNGNLQVIEHVSPTTWRLKNFPTYTTTQQCTDSSNSIFNVCGDTGNGPNNTGMNKTELASCMECIYGLKTKFTCSRDNFAIRPNSFSFVLNDTNQSSAPKHKLIDNVSSTKPSIDLATGYEYNIDINATNYIDNNASDGYTKLFNTVNTQDSMTYIWSQKTPLATCNDANKTLSFHIFNGSVDLDLPPFDQVGQYQLNLLDTSWTAVDHNPVFMGHHTSANAIYPDGTPMFETTSLDCKVNSAFTQDENSSELSGCNISSEHNSSSGVITSNIVAIFHPYKLDVTSLIASHGSDKNITFPTAVSSSAWIYMSDIAHENNISLNFIGDIVAKGFNNTNNSNFVDGCYAKPLTLSLKSDLINANPDYKYHFVSREVNSSVIYDSWDANNSSQELLNLTTANFPKDANGSLSMTLHYNYEHNTSVALNPQKINLVGLDVRCTNASDCQMNVLQRNNYENNQTVSINAPLRHFYAKAYTGKQRFNVPADSPYNAKIYYQIYCFGDGCNTNLLPSKEHINDIRWYRNRLHNPNHDGNITAIFKKGSVGRVILTNAFINTTNPATVNLQYDGSKGYPYISTMEINASNWLIYNQNNENATSNQFQIEYNKLGTGYSGEHETTSETSTRGNIKTNRKTMW